MTKVLILILCATNLIYASNIDFEGTKFYNMAYVGAYNDYGKNGAKCVVNRFMNKLYTNGNMDKYGNFVKKLDDKDGKKQLSFTLDSIEECGFDASQLRAYFNQ